ncbi:MFS transporter [Deinococcus yavapaiensis]|uniref:DHA1 family multidrug resistance protein-like MFS transporter n=1 Tax=Deinococcus yavapaiensis KR-236 TaxID=694435 RepID=A0A318SNL7_9DEIO|nr:MFS transporter [Deinococcus yavapaiensis]PYE54239.1 DHA1 family multidrug resistance protein-like MFS transporter [Deinococcus yavapaiensis KR-236]
MSSAATALRALTFTNFLMWGGFFLIIPLVSVHYVANLGWTAASIGVVLGARQLTQQGLTVLGGALADKLGPRSLILWGCVLRALGFAVMGWATTFPALLGAAIFAGIGGSLFDAPKNAAVSALTTPETRARTFSIMSVFGNLGMVVGPLVGALLASYDFRLVAAAAGSVYLVAFVLIAATLPRVPAASSPEAGLGGIKLAATDARFVRFTLLASGYFILSTQLNVAVTLKATALRGEGGVAAIYLVNAGLAALLQYPLLRFLERRYSARRILVTGVASSAVGLGLIAISPSFVTLLLCVALTSFGGMLAVPTQQTLTARLARRGLFGAYFGFGALSLGVGGAIGNVLGGALYDFGERAHFPAAPWLVLLVIGTLTAIGLWRILDDDVHETAPQAAENAA